MAGVGPVYGVPKPPFPCFSINWLLIPFQYSLNFTVSWKRWFKWIGNRGFASYLPVISRVDSISPLQESVWKVLWVLLGEFWVYYLVC